MVIAHSFQPQVVLGCKTSGNRLLLEFCMSSPIPDQFNHRRRVLYQALRQAGWSAPPNLPPSLTWMQLRLSPHSRL